MKQPIYYAGVEGEQTSKEQAKIVLRSVPYDGTSTWGKGADKGFGAFLDASENMEIYDIETDSEVVNQGVYVAPELSGFETPEQMFEAVYTDTKQWLQTGKYITTFGGEHSISIGVIKAFYEHYENLSVLQIDAHADLRPNYLGTDYNHACALYDASQNTNLVQVGIRSMDASEKMHMNKAKCFFMHHIREDEQWPMAVRNELGEDVYLTIDLDGFDPSICPGTGTPEPGGFYWYELINFLRDVFTTKNVVGFDIVELAPIEGNKQSEFLAAKLYYKLLSYQFELKKK